VMRITLGSKGDYAVRAVLDLARAHGGPRRKAREISDKMDIPPKYLPQVLADLIKAGLVESLAGPGGGYSLSRGPADISLLEIVEAAEGPVRNRKCLMRGGPCHWDDACSLHAAWTNAQEKMVAELAKTTFAELARQDEPFEERNQQLVANPVTAT
ncbi:MAG TPA: Rrf2 family transcriptional regulator, partial [Actinomycetota bacterium]|nr:Rrf2 family transcriptional regulator [Actinomycetota bacterium]